MKRFAIAVGVLFLIFACSEKKSETSGEQFPASEIATGEQAPRQMIPDEPLEGELGADTTAVITPYFDEGGTITEKSISPGESFDVYIIAEYDEDQSMMAAEYRVQLPPAVSILSATVADSATLRSGNPEHDLMIAFHCTPGPRLVLTRYVCSAGETFTGGTIETGRGLQQDFIGLVLCGDYPLKIPAHSGTATLKRK